MKQVFRTAIAFLLLWSCLAQAQVRIEITQGVDSARPIGIAPFRWAGQGAIPENIRDIIAADLRNSGKFNPVDVTRIPEKPDSVAAVNPALWAASGIDAVVVGQVEPAADGNYLVSYQLVDTVSTPGKILIQNQYKVTEQWLRYAAHTASDEIFAKLTGIKGAFRTRIAYIVKTGKEKISHELRVADYDGYNQFVVHRSSEPLMSPAWSSDGSKIAYVTFESRRAVLVIQTLANGAIKQVASFQRHNGAPAFSPDGKKLVFASSKDGSLNLYVMHLDSGQINQVTDGRNNNTEPAWFPDSENLVYTSDQGGRPQLYKVSIYGGVPQRLTWEGYQNQNAHVSFDGKFIVMVSSNKGTQHISKQDLGTGAIQELTDTFLDETPSIAPNGTMVIYSSSQGLGTILQLVSTDGRFKARLPATDGQIKSPAWSPYL